MLLATHWFIKTCAIHYQLQAKVVILTLLELLLRVLVTNSGLELEACMVYIHGCHIPNKHLQTNAINIQKTSAVDIKEPL